MRPRPRHPRLQLALVTVLVATSAVLASQQRAGLAGPVIGLLWDAHAAELRLLSGTPGSALIGEPLAIGVPAAHVLPLDGYRLLLSSPGGSTLWSGQVTSEGLVLRPVNAAELAPSASALSAGGIAAALYDQHRQRVTLLGGLPEHPHVTHTIDLPPFNLPLTSLAVSDTGSLLAFALAGAAATTIYAWTPAAGTRLVSDMEAASALAFVDDTLLVVNPVTNEVVRGRDLDTSPRWERFAGPLQGLARPVGIAVTSARRIYIADAHTGSVMTLDDRGRVLARQACACEISGLHRLQPSVYRLTDSIDRTMFLLDMRPGAPRITFVPPAARSGPAAGR